MCLYEGKFEQKVRGRTFEVPGIKNERLQGQVSKAIKMRQSCGRQRQPNTSKYSAAAIAALATAIWHFAAAVAAAVALTSAALTLVCRGHKSSHSAAANVEHAAALLLVSAAVFFVRGNPHNGTHAYAAAVYVFLLQSSSCLRRVFALSID
ncbi:hypothetical protein B0H13DRAFT_1897620 [Mycena leptocephala]|nr:hypothetical protein B0H13DRAFT_1897620 [Mycena leptocephala]